MSDFPILDYARTPHLNAADDGTPGRIILDVGDPIEPYVDETDYWVAMPLRLVHGTTSGICIEMGPYTLDRADIENLRYIIASHDRAVGLSFPEHDRLSGGDYAGGVGE